ncbi:unnamed protein product [Lupinus luteus]|uniref:Uncharacterized protein n=1 Tax=Lupinus luteus TaxID=3873 RepID=A0AAV1XYH9_LUPLU
MKGIIDEGKEISPMFPRLHVKDAEKGGPKPPPRNKMALYEQFNIPSQTFASGSTSLYPLSLRKCTIPSTSTHVSSNQTIQFCTSSATSIVAENIQVYNSRKQHNFMNTKQSLKIFDIEDVSITSGSDYGKNSSCSLIENDKDEDKLDNCNLICSLKSPSSFQKKVSSPESIELKLAQYGKKVMEEHSEMSRKGWKPEEESANPIDGFPGMADSSFLSLNKDRNYKLSMKEYRFLKEEAISISKECLKTLQGNNAEAHEEHDEAFADKVDLQDDCMETTADNDVYKCPDESEIGKGCLLSKRDRNEDEETYRDYDVSNRPSAECKSGADISHDSVVEVLGLKNFWKARKIIINRSRKQVQKTIAAPPHLLLEDNLVSNKQSLKLSAIKKLQSDYQQPPSIVKLNTKSEKPPTIEHAKNIAFGKIPLPCLNNISKGLPNFGHDLRNPALGLPDINIKQSPSCVFPPPGNQWLVPVMSPSEGLVYKPMVGPCPPNPGFMPPVHNTFSTMAFNLGSKDATDASAVASGSHQRTGILSGSSLPNSLPSPFMPPPMLPVSAVEHIGQSNGPEEANSAILYQSSSNLSSQASRAISRNVPTTYHSLKEKESQTSTATSPPKRVKGDVLPLFPVAPTLWPSTKDKNKNVENQPRVIKAMPHTPKSATESAARIFRSIQEERKFL